MSYKFNPFTSNFDLVNDGGAFWLSPVANLTALNLITTDTDGSIRVTLDTNDAYRWNSGGSAWQYVGKVKAGAAGSTPNNNGFSVGSDNTITLQPADATRPGIVSTASQGFSGDKTFNNKLIVQSQSNGTPALQITGVSGGTHPNFFAVARDTNFLVFDNADSTSIALALSYNGQVGIGTTPNGNAQLDIRTTANQYGLQLFNPASLPQDFIRFYDGSNALLANVDNTGRASFANIIDNGLTANTVPYANASKQLTSSIVTPTELGYSSGVTSAIQTQFTNKLSLSGGTMSGAINMGSNKITSVTDPTSAQDAATKNYVDSVASGLNPKQAAYAGSTANIAGTYSNGVAGVGATFTVTATGAFSIDGVSPPVGSRILLKDQTSGFQNGVYDLTLAGSLGVSPILTRSLDYNTATDMNAGDLIPVIAGTVNAITSWLQTATITTVGTDSLTFVEWSYNPASFLLKSSNLSDVSSSLTSFNNISGLTTLGDTLYGGASGTRTRLAGNTTTTKKFKTQTGDGVNSAAPGWNTIVASDLPIPNSAGDITETSFSAANNQSSVANVTGLAFANATVRSAKVLISVYVNATSSLYEVFELLLIQKGASWNISATSVGDASGFTFSVTNAGQVQYVNSNYSGFVAATVKFRAITTSV